MVSRSCGSGVPLFVTSSSTLCQDDGTPRSCQRIGLPLVDVREDFHCEDYIMGKQSRKPFSRVTTVDNCKPAEKLYADLAGEMPFAYLMKTNDETTACVKDCVAYLENQTGTTVKKFLTDNGAEFVNKNLKTFFGKNGIYHETSAPYCTESNGKIEREKRTIKDCARTTLIAADLPQFLWAEAVSTTVYVHNRVFDKQSLYITSFEAIFKKKPSVGHLRVFECTAYAHIPDPNSNAFDPKSTKMVLVGYWGENKYRL
ncbi:unnamed protein product [Allacma fusca]|uniref:Integrase catalytic domain-containing protein n=1 Tax=Allacma fusca TaxID=39272 RepID=A0A8J2L9H6_9HEXA|nr:unnamed protein product [Allacma fusca]